MKNSLFRLINLIISFFVPFLCYAEGMWTLVTDVSTLKTGDKVIIVAKDYYCAMGKSASDASYQSSVEVVLEDEICTINDEVQILDVTLNDGSFYLKVGDKYLCADKSGNNNLQVKGKSNGYPDWNITIEDGVTKIKADAPANIPSLIQYNLRDKRFSCYLYEVPERYHVSLYKFVEGQDEVKDSAEIILVDAGKQSSDTIKTYIGSSYPLPTTASKVEGLDFVGWSATPIVAGSPIENGSILPLGSSVKIEKDTIFYSVYAKPISSGESAYIKIDSEQEDWTGDYLIVYEQGSKAFNGSLIGNNLFKENAADIEFSENKIALNKDTEQYEFRIEKYDDGYSIKSKSGYYIGIKNGEGVVSKTLSSNYQFQFKWSEQYSPLKTGPYYLCFASKRFTFSFSQHTPVQLYKRTNINKSYVYYTTSISTDVTINRYGYSTWYSGMPVEVPAGMIAYTCLVEGSTALLTDMGKVIPANTGAVLYAANAVGIGANFMMNYTNEENTAMENSLIGFVEDTEVADGKAHYALNVKDGIVGFYIPQTTTDTTPSATSTFTAKAGKAYLELEYTNATSFALRRGEASIAVSTSCNAAVVYNLMGRKVSTPSQGVYIVNGRKMIIPSENYK